MSENPSSANDENREQGALESANSTPENEGAESNVDPEPFVKPKKPLNVKHLFIIPSAPRPQLVFNFRCCPEQ